MYLTRDATLATFRQVAALAPGSTLAMTFVLPVEQMAPEVRPGIEMAVKAPAPAGRRSSASMRRPRSWRWRGGGFRDVRHVAPAVLAQRYFAGERTA